MENCFSCHQECNIKYLNCIWRRYHAGNESSIAHMKWFEPEENGIVLITDSMTISRI